METGLLLGFYVGLAVEPNKLSQKYIQKEHRVLLSIGSYGVPKDNP